MVKPLAKSLANVYKSVVRCENCGNLKVIQNKCICEENNKIMRKYTVENLADMWVIGHQIFLKVTLHLGGYN